jgi:hypothetical protein
MPKRPTKAERREALNALIYSDALDGHIDWADDLERQRLESATNSTLACDIVVSHTESPEAAEDPKHGGPSPASRVLGNESKADTPIELVEIRN